MLSDGRRVEGPITFIGQQSDPATRTYPVEIQIANPDYALRSGLTTEIRIPVREVMAQKISPALFALNDAVKSACARSMRTARGVPSGRDRRDEADGVWVSGLPDVATLITVGQELVVPGELVEVDYEACRRHARSRARWRSSDHDRTMIDQHGDRATCSRPAHEQLHRCGDEPHPDHHAAHADGDAGRSDRPRGHSGRQRAAYRGAVFCRRHHPRGHFARRRRTTAGMPMEIELRKVEGVEELTSYCVGGIANLLVEFDADYDLDQALMDVREAVDRAKVELPSTAEEPFVQENSPRTFPSSRSTWSAMTCPSACSTT